MLQYIVMRRGTARSFNQGPQITVYEICISILTYQWIFSWTFVYVLSCSTNQGQVWYVLPESSLSKPHCNDSW